LFSVASKVLWSGAKGCKGKGKGWAKGKGKGKGLFACLWPAESSSSAEDSGEKEAKTEDAGAGALDVSSEEEAWSVV